MSQYGIDISSYQDTSNIDWKAVAADGKDFVIVKSTQGNYYINPDYVRDASAALAEGIAVSAYHFLDPKISGNVQGSYFLSEISKAQVEVYLVMLDIETNPLDDFGSVWRQALAFRQTVEAAGYKVMFYVNGSYYQALEQQVPVFPDGSPIMFADPGVPEVKLACDIWQYGVEVVNGITGQCDVDEFIGTGTVAEFFSLGGLPLPAQQPTGGITPESETEMLGNEKQIQIKPGECGLIGFSEIGELVGGVEVKQIEVFLYAQNADTPIEAWVLSEGPTNRPLLSPNPQIVLPYGRSVAEPLQKGDNSVSIRNDATQADQVVVAYVRWS